MIESIGWDGHDSLVVSISNMGGHDTGIRRVTMELERFSGETGLTRPIADVEGDFDYPFGGIIVRSGERLDFTFDRCAPLPLERMNLKRLQLEVIPVLGKAATASFDQSG